MGAREPIIVEGPSPTMEDTFHDLHSQSHQTSTISLEATKRERIEPEVTATERSPRQRAKRGIG